MTALVIMTPEDDALVSDMRAAGCTWAYIAHKFGVRAGTVCNRYLRRLRLAAREKSTEKFDDSREPLRAGHPATWGIICDAPFPTTERIH